MSPTVILLILLFTPVIFSLRGRADKNLNLCCYVAKPGPYVKNFNCEIANFQSGKENVTSTYMDLQVPGHVMFPPENGSVIFNLKYKSLNCQPENTREHVFELSKFSRGTTPTNFTRDGYLQIEKEFYHHNEYCLHKLEDTTVTVKYCAGQCWTPGGQRKKTSENAVEGKRPTACIRKCCDLGKSLKTRFDPMTNAPKMGCEWTDVPFKPHLYSVKSQRLLSPEQMENVDLHISRAPPKCGEQSAPMLLLVSKTKAKEFKVSSMCYKILTDGHMYYQDNRASFIPREDYCVDWVQERSENETGTTSSGYYDLVASVTCSLTKSEESHTGSATFKTYGGLLICASLFLLLTFIVYLLLWDHHGLHGWTTLGHSSSMFFMYVFLGCSHILSEGRYYGTLSCVVVSVFAHFFFISTFCWLTLISFDLWYTFRSFTPKSTSKKIKRFAFYVLFGWGVPAVVVIVSLTMDHLYKDEDCLPAILPLYGQVTCYLNPLTLGEYLYYPVAVLLTLNLLFFGVTTWKLYEYKQSTRMATENMENKQQFFKLFLKLFCVMGVTWMFEVISWLHVGVHVTWYYQVIDSVNVFQAFAIFVIYVCKKETILALESKYPRLKVILDPFIRLFECRQGRMDRSTETSSLNSSLTRHNTDKARASVMTKSFRISHNET